MNTEKTMKYMKEFVEQKGYSPLASHLLAEFKENVVDKFPQYNSYFNSEIRIVRAKKDKSARGRKWFSKGEVMLSFKEYEYRTDMGKPQFFTTILSVNSYYSCCLCPVNILEVVEVVR